MHSIIRAGAAIALAIAATACATDSVNAPEAPATTATITAVTPSAYTLHFTAPQSDDAGLLVSLRGATIDSVRASAGRAVLLADGDGASQLAVTPNDDASLDDVIVTVWTRDGAAPIAAVREVAARGTLAQRAIAGYAVDVQVER